VAEKERMKSVFGKLQTHRIAGIAFGDRSAETCRDLWEYLPADYRKRAVCCTDRLQSYASLIIYIKER